MHNTVKGYYRLVAHCTLAVAYRSEATLWDNESYRLSLSPPSTVLHFLFRFCFLYVTVMGWIHRHQRGRKVDDAADLDERPTSDKRKPHRGGEAHYLQVRERKLKSMCERNLRPPPFAKRGPIENPCLVCYSPWRRTLPQSQPLLCNLPYAW